MVTVQHFAKKCICSWNGDSHHKNLECIGKWIDTVASVQMLNIRICKLVVMMGHFDVCPRITSENVAEQFGVSREKQDRMAEISHAK